MHEKAGARAVIVMEAPPDVTDDTEKVFAGMLPNDTANWLAFVAYKLVATSVAAPAVPDPAATHPEVHASVTLGS